MSINQLHGKTYEDYLKSSFPGSSDHQRPQSSFWDIESTYDKEHNLPTSIKCSKNNIVYLSDARRFWDINESYRLLVANYRQNRDIKVFHRLFEFFIMYDEHKKLLGDVSKKDIQDFHNLLLSFRVGEHRLARVVAKASKKPIQCRTNIALNPKIDSKAQRRLQCSIKVETLLNFIKVFKVYNESDYYNNISVSFKIRSSLREF